MIIIYNQAFLHTKKGSIRITDEITVLFLSLSYLHMQVMLNIYADVYIKGVQCKIRWKSIKTDNKRLKYVESRVNFDQEIFY